MTIKNQAWWHSAVIYQIYPRSFFDTNQDGIGDLNGITEKLDYVAKLGVDAIWISPFLKSPQADFGYDVSDYYDVDPLFGNLTDFDVLIQKAHALNIRIIMDLVLNHTSIAHAWFQESKKDRVNSKADWYVWADATSEGGAPNNWLSVFGGSAWEWDETRQQYYFHNFLSSQPDLNFHNSEVIDAVLKAAEFWLERGVDGFRLDTANYYVHDKALRDNPLRAAHEPPAEGVPADNPYARQHHIYDKSRPENFEILKKIRKLMDHYPNAVTIGEIGDDNSLQTAASYVRGNEHLHMVYNFKLLDVSSDFSPKFIKEVVSELEAHIEDGWPCWSFSNHDVVRVATRFSKGKPNADLSKVLLALLFSLRGTVCLYQGEELGLTQSDVPFEKMQDPYGIRFYPVFKGRDGCRTPMPWNEKGGFSNVEGWLPLDEMHLTQAVSVQEKNKNSVLRFCQKFINWRKQYPALCHGAIQLLHADEGLLAFERSWEQEKIVLVFNLSDEEKKYAMKKPYLTLEGHGFNSVVMTENIILPPYSAYLGKDYE